MVYIAETRELLNLIICFAFALVFRGNIRIVSMLQEFYNLRNSTKQVASPCQNNLEMHLLFRPSNETPDHSGH